MKSAPMGNDEATRLNTVFSALGHDVRRDIVTRLAQGETPLSDLAEPYDMSLTAVSKHVRILCDAGLVAQEKRGRVRYCRLEASPMKDAAEWLETYRRFWTDQFEALARHLARERKADK